ncbi:hypothetical protein, partial [Pseudomonas viridiflava]|uniref:hypothetical protein n=1 Tax=Pseudomonas viridiflava TaxID=33069 RepID=UPI0019804FBB
YQATVYFLTTTLKALNSLGQDRPQTRYPQKSQQTLGTTRSFIDACCGKLKNVRCLRYEMQF